MESEPQLNLAFYSVFIGSKSNIAYAVPIPPSKKYDCFFFSNNTTILEIAGQSGWKPIFYDVTPKEEVYESNILAKHVKVLPHLFLDTKTYNYTCYIDSKLAQIDEEIVEDLIQTYFMNGDVSMILRKHWFVQGSVWNEYEESMNQERYVNESERYRNYIHVQLNSGLQENSGTHTECNFILRKHCPTQEKIDTTWFEHISQCGIQDQISFYFVRQLYQKHIIAIPRNIFVKPNVYS